MERTKNHFHSHAASLWRPWHQRAVEDSRLQIADWSFLGTWGSTKWTQALSPLHLELPKMTRNNWLQSWEAFSGSLYHNLYQMIFDLEWQKFQCSFLSRAASAEMTAISDQLATIRGSVYFEKLDSLKVIEELRGGTVTKDGVLFGDTDPLAGRLDQMAVQVLGSDVIGLRRGDFLWTAQVRSAISEVTWLIRFVEIPDEKPWIFISLEIGADAHLVVRRPDGSIIDYGNTTSIFLHKSDTLEITTRENPLDITRFYKTVYVRKFLCTAEPSHERPKYILFKPLRFEQSRDILIPKLAAAPPDYYIEWRYWDPLINVWSGWSRASTIRMYASEPLNLESKLETHPDISISHLGVFKTGLTDLNYIDGTESRFFDKDSLEVWVDPGNDFQNGEWRNGVRWIQDTAVVYIHLESPRTIQLGTHGILVDGLKKRGSATLSEGTHRIEIPNARKFLISNLGNDPWKSENPYYAILGDKRRSAIFPEPVVFAREICVHGDLLGLLVRPKNSEYFTHCKFGEAEELLFLVGDIPLKEMNRISARVVGTVWTDSVFEEIQLRAVFPDSYSGLVESISIERGLSR